MMNLFIEGGLVKMSLITILAIFMFVTLLFNAYNLRKKKDYKFRFLNFILVFGILALVVPFLMNSLAAYNATQAIEVAGDISWSLLATGIRIALISNIYGLFVMLFSVIVWGIMKEIDFRKGLL